jgi:hypothetical protein
MLGELGTCQPALARAESAGAPSCKRVPRSDAGRAGYVPACLGPSRVSWSSLVQAGAKE